MNSLSTSLEEGVAASQAGARTSTLKVGLLLVLLLGAWATLARPGVRSVDPLELLRTCFQVQSLPKPWSAKFANKLPDHSSLVLLTHDSSEPEPPRIEPPKEKSKAKGQASQQEPIDWDRLPMGKSDSEPVEIMLAQYPIARGAREIERLFQGGGGTQGPGDGRGYGAVGSNFRGEQIGNQGGKRILERGVFTWGDFAAPFVLEREYEAGGTFRDFVRVNLSGKNTPRLLVARWARGSPASKARLQAWLSQCPPRAAAGLQESPAR